MLSVNAVTKKQRVRGKYWVFTINNYSDDDLRQFENITELCSYYIAAKEIGDNGNLHLQCFVAFKRVTEFNQLKTIWPRGHFELMACKDPNKAALYCKKGQQSHKEWDALGEKGPSFGLEADFIEFGTVPDKQGAAGGKATKDMWLETMNCVKSNQFDLIQPNILIAHYSNLRKIYYDVRPKPADLIDVCGVWIYGKPGVGKSYKARQEYKPYYDKMFNKWWDGYQDEPYILLDDFDLEHKIFGHHLKRWADRYSFSAEVKNHVETIRPLGIVVTSNYHPSEIWEGVMLEAIIRRFEIHHMVKIKDSDDTKEKEKKRKIINAPVKEKVSRVKLFRQDATGNIVATNGKELLTQKLLSEKAHTTFTPNKIDWFADSDDEEISKKSNLTQIEESDEISVTLGSEDTYSEEDNSSEYSDIAVD